MKPSAFTYFAPRSLEEALALLAEYAPDALPLAGGQSLVQRMNLREISPCVLLDLNSVPELAYMKLTADGALLLGAMTRQQRLVDANDLHRTHPALVAAASAVAFPAVRSRGTLGGSVANAEPGAQLPLMLAVLDASATITSRTGSRTVPFSSVITGYRQTSLAADELLVELTVPTHSPTTSHAIGEFRRGHSGPPLVSVAVVLDTDDTGAITTARMGVSGSSELPLRLHDEEQALAHQMPSPVLFREVARQAAARVSSGDPVLADASLRREATRALLERALREASARAQQFTSQGEHA